MSRGIFCVGGGEPSSIPLTVRGGGGGGGHATNCVRGEVIPIRLTVQGGGCLLNMSRGLRLPNCSSTGSVCLLNGIASGKLSTSHLVYLLHYSLDFGLSPLLPVLP